MKRHIRYLKLNSTICMRPDLLGEDFVTVDYEPFDAPSCEECYQLLITHNKREEKIDKAWADIVRGYNSHQPDEQLSAARGIMTGLLLSLPIWFLIILLIWVVFR